MASFEFHPDLVAFLEGTDAALPRLSALALDFEAELDALGAAGDVLPVSVSSDALLFRAENDDGDLFGIEITGSGFSPVLTEEAFGFALENGLASGEIDRIAVTTGGTEILRIDTDADRFVLTSGIHRLEVDGTLPDTVGEIFELVSLLQAVEDPDPDTIFGEAVEDLFEAAAAYDIDALRLFEENDELLSLTWSQTQAVLTAEGYTLTVAGTLPEPAELLPLFDTGELPFGQVEIFRPDGTSLGTTQFDESFGFLFADDRDPIPGTYHIAVSATNGGTTGFYTFDVQAYGQIPEQPESLWLEDGASVPDEILAEVPPEFAPQQPGEIGGDIDNALSVPLGALVLGSIGAPGDVDVFAVDFPTGTNEGVSLGVTLISGPGPATVQALDALVDLDTVTLTDPDGDDLLRIFDIDDLADLEDALLELEAEVGIPIISDPDDPGFPGEPSDPDVVPEEPIDPIIAWITGDPHLLTLDGMDYDFHAAGEYLLLREVSGSTGFELQSRMAPVGDNVSANIAAAMRASDGTAVMIDAADATPLWIGGENTALADGASLAVGPDRLYRNGDTYIMVFAGEDGVVNAGDDRIGVAVFDNRVDIGVTVDNPGFARSFEGLLGDGDGNPDNDIFLRDGTVLSRPLTFDDLYGPLRDDWRISEAESLFTYDTGESTDGFYLPNFPTGMTSIDDFAPADIEAARQAVRDGGLAEGTANFENAVLDFLLTGDTSFIDSAASAPGVSTPEVPSTASAETDTSGGLTGLSTLTVQVANSPAGGMAHFTPTGANSAIMARGDAAGQHSFQLVSGESGTVTGLAAHDENRGDPRITVGDALDVLRMAIGLDPTEGTADAFDFIAADLDRNGRVEVGDALTVLRYAIGLETANAPRWIYAEAGLDLSAVTSRSVPTELGVAIDPIDGDLDISMQAILLGSIEAGDLPIA